MFWLRRWPCAGDKKEPVYGLRLLLEHYPTGMETFMVTWKSTRKRGEEVEQGQNIARTGLEPLGKSPPSISKYGKKESP